MHDGASNMRECAALNGWTDVGCSAHKVHLCVTSAMGIDKVSNTAISKCVGAASRLVGHFSHSPMATGELQKRQVQMEPEKNPVKLIQYVKTRWNSVFDMFDRLVQLRWPVVAVLSDRNVTKPSDAKALDLKDEHWTMMSDLLPVLQPLQVLTSLYSAADQPSASAVYPTLWSFVKVGYAYRPIFTDICYA